MNIYSKLCQKLKNKDMITESIVKEKETELGLYDLIDGTFSADDASEILNYLINKKINFHKARNFSSEIRFGKSDKDSIKRSKELIESKAQMNEVIKKAIADNKKLKIKSKISIELV